MVTIAADAAPRLARYQRRADCTEFAQPRVGSGITSWPEFYATVVDRPLLAKLDDFRNALLIGGCDWSAVTAVTHLFKRLPGFADSPWSHYDELDDALLLAGLRPRRGIGRRCFQTTYLRERYREYWAHQHFKLVWIVREPRAAVHSLLSTRGRAWARWPEYGLDRNAERQGASRLENACAAYAASLRQMLELKERLGERLAVVDYDELSADRARLLPALCRFAAVDCDATLLRHLHGKSVRKGALASFQTAIVDQLTMPLYQRACSAGILGSAHG